MMMIVKLTTADIHVNLVIISNVFMNLVIPLTSYPENQNVIWWLHWLLNKEYKSTIQIYFDAFFPHKKY